MRNFLSTALTLLAGLAVATPVKVLPGDTLTRLSVRYGTTPQALLRANPGLNPNRLSSGTLLQLPTPSARMWTVRQGDTLSKIAQQQGATLTALLRVNPSLNPRQPLQVGQRLNLPVPFNSRSSVPTLRAASSRAPAQFPVQGRLTTRFSADHAGLDLAVPLGTPIRVPLPGTVTESQFDGRSGWGWTIVVDHGNGLTTRYSHNSVNLVRAGNVVTAGQMIARAGSTGKSTGAHVDYRLYRQGQAVNPFTLQ